MIDGLKPYPEYKESGQTWLGKCPAHWSQRRMKFLFGERVQKGFPDEPLLAATQTKGVVRKEEYGERTVTASKDFHLLKLVEPGDFVIRLRSFQGGIEVAHCRGIISPAYTVLAPNQESRRAYFTHFFKSPDFISSLTLFVTGIREGQNVDYVRMSRAYLPLPPEDEQEAMGRFLDHANVRIERAIRAKKKLIALLNEQKQAIIHRAVTRGLDPNVPLKPSGIPWLGDIPEHWDVRKLRTVADLIVSNVDKHSKPNEQSVRLCNYTDVYKNETVNGELDFMRATATKDEVRKFKLKIGDVIITKDSEEWADIGVPALVAHEADDLVCGYHLGILRPSLQMLRGEFLLRALQDRFVATQMHVRAKGVTRYGLSHLAIKDIWLPIPGLEEQAAICAALAKDLAQFTTAITRSEREIGLLREYRTRLIADVVTGKLDVRAAARHLPAESAEPAATLDLDTDDVEELEPLTTETA